MLFGMGILRGLYSLLRVTLLMGVRKLWECPYSGRMEALRGVYPRGGKVPCQCDLPLFGTGKIVKFLIGRYIHVFRHLLK